MRKVYTTGAVSKICRVAPRTVSKWFDQGRFPGSYRIPGSGDRRITRNGLVAFLREHGMVDALDDLIVQGCVLLVGPCEGLIAAVRDEGRKALHALNLFRAGLLFVRHGPQAVVVDFAVGTGEALALADQVRGDESVEALANPPYLLALVGEDWAEGADRLKHFNAFVKKPASPSQVRNLLAEAYQSCLTRAARGGPVSGADELSQAPTGLGLEGGRDERGDVGDEAERPGEDGGGVQSGGVGALPEQPGLVQAQAS
jgi:two-component system, OmpR family, response regulator RpaA